MTKKLTRDILLNGNSIFHLTPKDDIYILNVYDDLSNANEYNYKYDYRKTTGILTVLADIETIYVRLK